MGILFSKSVEEQWADNVSELYNENKTLNHTLDEQTEIIKTLKKQLLDDKMRSLSHLHNRYATPPSCLKELGDSVKLIEIVKEIEQTNLTYDDVYEYLNSIYLSENDSEWKWW